MVPRQVRIAGRTEHSVIRHHRHPLTIGVALVLLTFVRVLSASADVTPQPSIPVTATTIATVSALPRASQRVPTVGHIGDSGYSFFSFRRSLLSVVSSLPCRRAATIARRCPVTQYHRWVIRAIMIDAHRTERLHFLGIEQHWGSAGALRVRERCPQTLRT